MGKLNRIGYLIKKKTKNKFEEISGEIQNKLLKGEPLFSQNKIKSFKKVNFNSEQTEDKRIENFKFYDCNFSNSIFKDSRMYGSEFHNNNFTGSIFKNCIIKWNYFIHNTFKNSNFISSFFIDTTFTDTDFTNSIITSCDFRKDNNQVLQLNNNNFSNCSINYCSIDVQTTESCFRVKELASCDIKRLIMKKCNNGENCVNSNRSLFRKNKVKLLRIKNSNMSNYSYENNNFIEGNFESSNLKKSIFKNNSSGIQVEFYECDLSDSTFENEIFQGNFNKCTMNNCKFSNSTFNSTSFTNIIADIVEFLDVDLNQAVFKNCKIKSLVFKKCSLKGANFENIEADYMNFEGSNLTQTNLNINNKCTFNFKNTTLYLTILDKSKISDQSIFLGARIDEGTTFRIPQNKIKNMIVENVSNKYNPTIIDDEIVNESLDNVDNCSFKLYNFFMQKYESGRLIDIDRQFLRKSQENSSNRGIDAGGFSRMLFDILLKSYRYKFFQNNEDGQLIFKKKIFTDPLVGQEFIKATKVLVIFSEKTKTRIVIDISDLLLETLKIMRESNFSLNGRNENYLKKLNGYNKIGSFTFDQMINYMESEMENEELSMKNFLSQEPFNIKSYMNEGKYPKYGNNSKKWVNAKNVRDKRIFYFRNFLYQEGLEMEYFKMLLEWYSIIYENFTNKILFDYESLSKRIFISYNKKRESLSTFDVSSIDNQTFQALIRVLKNGEKLLTNKNLTKYKLQYDEDIIRKNFQKWVTGSVNIETDMTILIENKLFNEIVTNVHTCFNRIDIFQTPSSFDPTDQNMINEILLGARDLNIKN